MVAVYNTEVDHLARSLSDAIVFYRLREVSQEQRTHASRFQVLAVEVAYHCECSRTWNKPRGLFDPLEYVSCMAAVVYSITDVSLRHVRVWQL